MLQNLLILPLIISLMIIGIHATTWQKMIFYHPAKWLKSKLPVWLHKPLFSCVICMSSVWSLLFMCIFGFPKWHFMPFVILIVAGINTIITSIIAQIIPDEE